MPSVTTAWAKPIKHGNDIVTYRIYRRVNAAPWASPPPIYHSTTPSETSARIFVDTSVSAGNSYEYICTGVDEVGNESPFSNSALVSAGSDAPSAPLNLAVAPFFPTTTAVKIQWDPPATIPSVVGEYVVYHNSVELATVPGDTTVFKHDNLQPSTGHIYAVSARSASGAEGPQSSGVSATTLADTQAPSAPSNLLLSCPDDHTVVVDWQESDDNVKPVNVTYVIRRSTSGIPTTIVQNVSHPATIWIDNTRTPNTNYNYSVEAVDASFNVSGNVSNSVTTPTSGGGVPNTYNVPDTPTVFTNLLTGQPETYHVPCTGDVAAGDVTLRFREWVREAVPNGRGYLDPNYIVFPTTGGWDGGTALLWMESGVRFDTRRFLAVKGRGARVICHTQGYWVNWAPEKTEPGWPKKRIQFSVRNSFGVYVQGIETWGFHFPGNPGYLPNTDPVDGAPVRANLLSTMSAGATTMHIDRAMRGRPLAWDQWWSTTWAGSGPGFNGSMGPNFRKPFNGYYLWVGVASGTAPKYESVLVTGDAAHADGISGHRTLTVVRGRNIPWGVPAQQWPAGTQCGPGKIGAWGGDSGSTSEVTEFQHGFSVTKGGPGSVGLGGNSLTNCKSRYPNGSNFEISDEALTTTIIDCEADHGGRQGLTPNSAADLLVVNLTIHDIAWSAIDIEPAADATKLRDVTIRGTDAAHPMQIARYGGAFCGNGGRGRGTANDGRFYVDNIVLKDIDVIGSIGIRGDANWAGSWGNIYAARGIHVFKRLVGHQRWGSPIDMITLFRCKGVTIEECYNQVLVSGPNNGGPLRLNVHCTDANGTECLLPNGQPNPAARVAGGGSIGAKSGGGLNNDWPGWSGVDWKGAVEGPGG